jgi:L-ascorbate metabolism protein UlaG (beta-lactamase superfamily)
MKITWIGHSALKLEGSKTVFIDPFITGNPAATMGLDKVTKADVVVVTHDHGDHLGDGYAICKKTGATLVAIYEIAEAAAQQGAKAEGMNVGGSVNVGGVTVSLVPAFHTGGLGGTAVGAIVEMDGKKVYHAGDTGLTMEMQLIGEMYNMGPRLAAKAVELLKVPKTVPIHYDTFPLVQSSPEEFKKLVGNNSQVIVLKPGEIVEI